MSTIPGVSASVLKELAEYDTPTVCNVIELWNLRSRSQGYMNDSIRACFPQLPPMVGYALTSTFRSMAPPRKEQSYGSIPVTPPQENGPDETLPLTANARTHNKKSLCSWERPPGASRTWAGLVAVSALLLIGAVIHSQHPRTEIPTAYEGDPFRVSPVALGKIATTRQEDASPSVIWGNRTGPLPTNSWYLVRCVIK